MTKLLLDAKKVGKFVGLNFVSRVAGWAASARFPKPLLNAFIKGYSTVLGVDLSEAEKEVGQFETFSEFFCRELKPSARQVDKSSDTIVSPADGVLQEFGQVIQGRAIQVKGIEYSVAELLGSQKDASLFEDGWRFTVYLSPRDYHRVHSPTTGEIIRWRYLPGTLFPVNPPFVRSLKNLYVSNERTVTFIRSELGLVCVVMVGASFVGGISMTYLNEFKTNASKLRERMEGEFQPGIRIQKGDELGRFGIGSTVVVFVQGKDWVPQFVQEGMKIKYGSIVLRRMKTEEES